MEIFGLDAIYNSYDFEDEDYEYTQEDVEAALKVVFSSSTYNRETDFFWDAVAEMSCLIGTVMEILKEGREDG